VRGGNDIDVRLITRLARKPNGSGRRLRRGPSLYRAPRGHAKARPPCQTSDPPRQQQVTRDRPARNSVLCRGFCDRQQRRWRCCCSEQWRDYYACCRSPSKAWSAGDVGRPRPVKARRPAFVLRRASSHPLASSPQRAESRQRPTIALIEEQQR
jgi:hypothetical protein